MRHVAATELIREHELRHVTELWGNSCPELTNVTLTLFSSFTIEKSEKFRGKYLKISNNICGIYNVSIVLYLK